VDTSSWATHPTIAEFLFGNEESDLMICVAYSSDMKASHTFAVDGGAFYDQNTGRKIVGSDELPDGVEQFRVLTRYRVRKSER
jgi:hypothetical protein